MQFWLQWFTARSVLSYRDDNFLKLNLSERSGNCKLCNLPTSRHPAEQDRYPFVRWWNLSGVKAANLQHCPPSARRENPLLRWMHPLFLFVRYFVKAQLNEPPSCLSLARSLARPTFTMLRRFVSHSGAFIVRIDQSSLGHFDLVMLLYSGFE